MINIGLIGFGYWGPNLARNFNNDPNLALKSICDFSQDRQKIAGNLYPQVELVDKADEILKDNKIDAIAIATPVSTHYELAKEALLSGKHVWWEKPLAETVDQTEELIEVAEKKNVTLFVDHTFIYTGAVQKIKELTDKGELGELIYYDSTRVNLGLFQQDIDVIWDLAPHDISIMDYIMPFKKLAVSATGCNYFGNSEVAKALLTIFMDHKTVGHINVSWVSPVKVRQTLIGGTSKMIVYDDNQPSEKVKVYDKGVDLYKTKEALYHLKIQYRIGDMFCPKLEGLEALSFATSHFVECMNNGKKPMTDGKAGLEVVKVLAASKKSLAGNGVPIEL